MTKKYVLFLLLPLTLIACSYNARILLPQDTTEAMLQKGKYDLKAAVIVTPDQMNETVKWGFSFKFKPYPEMFQLAQQKLKKVFSTVDIVGNGEVIKDRYDVLINTTTTYWLSEVSFCLDGIDAKSGGAIFRISSGQRHIDETRPGLDTQSIMTGAGKYYEKTISDLLAKAMDEAVDALMRNKKFIAYTEEYRIGKNAGSNIVRMVKSDVDELPAAKAKPRRNAYAIVIGIENYRQKLPAADFATHDAQTVSEYLVKVLGYPEENVITLLNDHASNVDLAKYFEKWLPNNVERGGTVFIYYSGHGAPNPKTGDAYIVPYDGDPSFIDQTGYSLKRMYVALEGLQAKEIVVALDSCFSGAGGRSVLAQGARPLVMNLEKSFVLSKNITVLVATSGEQISSTYMDKGHGLFTYFMLKGIKTEDVTRADGTIRINDLFDYVKPQVERIARKQFNNEQSPQLMGQK